MEYTFTLKYALTPADADIDEVMERLGAQGCTDAIAGVGQPSRIALQFTRSANSAQAALQSALTDVAQAIPRAVLVEVDADHLGQPDVAVGLGK